MLVGLRCIGTWTTRREFTVDWVWSGARRDRVSSTAFRRNDHHPTTPRWAKSRPAGLRAALRRQRSRFGAPRPLPHQMELRFAFHRAVHRFGCGHRWLGSGCSRRSRKAVTPGGDTRLVLCSRMPDSHRYFGFGHRRSSMSGPNTSQAVLANSLGETAMRGNVGATVTKCGRLGSRWRFFRSIERRSESRASFCRRPRCTG